jgi:DNA-binding GntR family transcriptional regulator
VKVDRSPCVSSSRRAVPARWPSHHEYREAAGTFGRGHEVSRPRAVSVVEAVAEQIREDIYDGEFRPGDALVEGHLAERYGVPRPTLRSSLAMLVHDGILRREHNKSVYVPRLSVDDVHDLFAARKLIELEAIRRVTASQAASPDLEHALTMMTALSAGDVWDEMLRYDFEFHSALVAATGSERLQRFYRSIGAEMRLALSYFRSPRASPKAFAEEHRHLLELIRSGDADAAAEACRLHIEESEAFIHREAQELDDARADAVRSSRDER